jgi:DNA-binding SARP family transcriptional activator
VKGEKSLKLRTFGGLSIENAVLVGGSAARRRPLALLALLAVAGRRGLSRDKVVALLWPDSDAERARNSLSQALSAIRRELGADDVVLGSAELRLNPEILTSDVEEFEIHLGAGELVEAVALHAAPFLDGVFIKGAPEFERWIDQERLRLTHRQSEALQTLALAADARGDHLTAVRWWRRVAAIEPTLARGARGLMEALTTAGDRASALQHYRVYETLLRDEFGVPPDESLTTLAKQLRRFNGESIAPDGGELHAVAVSPTETNSERSVEPLAITAPRNRERGIRNAAAFAVSVAVFAAALIAWRTVAQPREVAQKVAVVRFANLTGDSALDGIGIKAADLIVDGLARSGLPVTIEPRMRSGQPRADDASAGHGLFLVSGHYSREGDSLVVVAQLANESGRTLIAAMEPVPVTSAAPDSALDRLRQRILGGLAVQLADTLAEILPAASTSTPTLPAYREFVDGLGLAQLGFWDTAVRRFHRAYELDSTFLAPLEWQVFAFSNLGDRLSADSVVRVMAGQRTRMSPLDRLVLEQLETRNDPTAAIGALRRAVKLAPGSIWAYNLGLKLVRERQFREAAAVFEQIDRRHGWIRNWPSFWRTFADAFWFDDVRQLEVAREGRRALPSDLYLVFAEARALATLGRLAEFEKVLTELETRPDPERTVGRELAILSKTFRRSGDTLWQRRLVQRSIAWYRTLPPVDAERIGNRRWFSQVLYDAGLYKDAEEVAERLVAENPKDSFSLTTLALCRVRMGDDRAGETAIRSLLAERGSVDYGENLVNAASIASTLGERDRAVRYLKEYVDRSGAELHDMRGNQDFDNLAGYEPYLALVTPLKPSTRNPPR